MLLRAAVGTIGTILLLPGLVLGTVGLLGLWLLCGLPGSASFAANDLGAGYTGILFLMFGGLPGLVLAGTGGFLLQRVRDAHPSDG